MKNHWVISAYYKRMMSLLVLIAVMMQAIIPHGYMLGRSSETGLLVIQMCSPAGSTRFVNFDPQTGIHTEIPSDALPAAPAEPNDVDNDHITTLCPQAETAHTATHLYILTRQAFRFSNKIGIVPNRGPPVSIAGLPLPARGPPNTL